MEEEDIGGRTIPAESSEASVALAANATPVGGCPDEENAAG